MSDQLGPLPDPFMELNREYVPAVYEAWANQMRAYAAAAVAEERERCAKLCEGMRMPTWVETTGDVRDALAEAMREPNKR